MRPPSRSWIPLSKIIFLFGHALPLVIVAARPHSHSPLPLLLNVRVEYMYINPLAWPRKRQAIEAHPLLFSVYLRALVPARPPNCKPSYRAVVRLVDLPLSPNIFLRSLRSLRAFSPLGAWPLFSSFLLSNSQTWTNHVHHITVKLLNYHLRVCSSSLSTENKPPSTPISTPSGTWAEMTCFIGGLDIIRLNGKFITVDDIQLAQEMKGF